MREAFRNFRTDRIAVLTATDERYGRRRLAMVKDWQAEREHEWADWAARAAATKAEASPE
jgi:predicted DNA-binding transcriptional regulator YafY